MTKLTYLITNSKKQYRMEQKIRRGVWYFLAFGVGYFTFMIRVVATR